MSSPAKTLAFSPFGIEGTNFLPDFFAIWPPSLQDAECGSTRFRWSTHVALPFVLPSKTCIHERVFLQGREYDCGIHNYLDRITTFPNTPQTWPSVVLTPRSQAHRPRPGWGIARETLQSVACFTELSEYSNLKDCFGNPAEKIDHCFRHLSEELARLQRAMPYLSAWQLFPIAQFDVGLVYHTAQHFCLSYNAWTHHATGVVINTARQTYQPFSHVDFLGASADDPAVELSNDLLAEAQASFLRGLYRSTVLNSYQSVESLANVVFADKCKTKLTKGGMSESEAAEVADARRRHHWSDIKFLLHGGLQGECGRSLFAEKKDLYDAVCKLKSLRNSVAHAGTRPSQDKAKAAHVLCCKVVQWLCALNGYAVRPLLPETPEGLPDIVSLPVDVNAVPAAAKAYLEWLLGIMPNEESLQSPPRFNLRIKFGQAGQRAQGDSSPQPGPGSECDPP